MAAASSFQHHKLPLEFSASPYHVKVDVDRRKYHLATVPDEEAAHDIIVGLATLLRVEAKVDASPAPGGAYYGVQVVGKDKPPVVWTIYMSQEA